MPYQMPSPPRDETCEPWPRAYLTHMLPLSAHHTAVLELPQAMTAAEWEALMAFLSIIQEVAVLPESRQTAPQQESNRG